MTDTITGTITSLSPAEVSQLLGPREFIRLCALIDARYGKKRVATAANTALGLGADANGGYQFREYSETAKFDITGVNREDGRLDVFLSIGRLAIAVEIYSGVMAEGI